MNKTPIFLLDGNIMNKLIIDNDENVKFVEKLSRLVHSGKLKFIQNHVAWAEVEDIKQSATQKLDLYDKLIRLRETLKIEEVCEETCVLDYSKFPIKFGKGLYKKHYGNKTAQKKKKDSHIYAAAKKHKTILVTENTKDFKRIKDTEVFTYDKFKKYIKDNHLSG